MKTILAMLAAVVITIVSQGTSMPASAAQRTELYNPGIIYPGPYAPEQLFYRNPKGEIWLRWTANDFAKTVTCKSALKGLRLTGVWKGHLKPNGSCGSTAEPSDWAVGNWINFYLLSTPKDND